MKINYAKELIPRNEIDWHLKMTIPEYNWAYYAILAACALGGKTEAIYEIVCPVRWEYEIFVQAKEKLGVNVDYSFDDDDHKVKILFNESIEWEDSLENDILFVMADIVFMLMAGQKKVSLKILKDNVILREIFTKLGYDVDISKGVIYL